MSEKKDVLTEISTNGDISKRVEMFDLIKKSNDLIKTIQLKQKDYAPVNERVMAFRRVNPNGRIITESSFSENYVTFEASIYDENFILLATGHAREYLKTEFALEKAETSAIGRALGLCGYGITTSLSSFEDMESVGTSQIFDEPSVDELVDTLSKVLTHNEMIDLLNSVHRTKLKDVPSNLLMAMIRFKEDEKHCTNG